VKAGVAPGIRQRLPRWRRAVTTPALSMIEQAILDILAGCPGGDVPGRDLRGMLRSRGFRRSAPALVFTMMSLEDKGLVTCREEVYVVDGVEIRERYYTARGHGW
jgi:hypothetical protein